MNRDVITDLVFANLLDLIPLIKNTDEEIDQAILRVYERTAAIYEEISFEYQTHELDIQI